MDPRFKVTGGGVNWIVDEKKRVIGFVDDDKKEYLIPSTEDTDKIAGSQERPDLSSVSADSDGELAELVRNPDLLITGTITRNSNGAATSANVIWPDGATGVYTATVLSTAFPGAVDAYTITRVLTGSTRTFAQPTVTRNSIGAVTVRPAITIDGAEVGYPVPPGAVLIIGG